MLASVDGIGKQNEFIRTNSKWETTDKNLKILLGQSNIDLRASICVSKLNIEDLHLICEYLVDVGVKEKNISVSNILTNPKKFSIKGIETDSLINLKNYIQENKHSRPLISDGLTKVLEWISQ